MMALKVLFVGRYDIAVHNIRPEAEMIIGLKQRGVDIEVMTRAECEYARRMQGCGIRIHDHVPTTKILVAIRSDTAPRIAQCGRHDIVHLFNNEAIVSGVFAAIGLPVKVVTYRGQTGNISRFDPVCYLTHLSPRVDAIVCVANAVRDSIRSELTSPAKATHDLQGSRYGVVFRRRPRRREQRSASQPGDFRADLRGE